MKKYILPFLILTSFTLLTGNVVATIRYVKPVATGLGTGLSWADASGDLQLMIINSAFGDTIWVAAGIHKPTRLANSITTISINNRDDAFVLKSNIKIFGGFNGTETLFSQRNISTNITTLSGDIGTLTDTVDNCYHVVISAGPVGSAELDGFTITKGNGGPATSITVNGQPIFRNNGSGMYNALSSPIVANCMFVSNTAKTNGGGMYNESGSSPSVSNCTFTSNTATSNGGGGIYNANTSSPDISNCTFNLNGTTLSFGGGILNSTNSTPSITGCTFISNSSNFGGGIHNNTCAAVISNCIFSGNTASLNGAAISNTSTLTGHTIINCGMASNVASNHGGGIYNNASSPVISNCNITANRALSTIGGGIYNLNLSNPVITSSRICGNVGVDGAGIGNNNSTPTILNCTISGNRATNTGGGVFNTTTSNAIIRNSIIYGNTATVSGPALQNNASTPVVNYCIIEGGFAGTANINSNPLFTGSVPASSAPTTTGDYSLQQCSPAINTGNNAFLSSGDTLDFAGNTRIISGIVDMGCYEEPASVVPNASGVVFVDSTKTGNGSSWANALSNVADALKIAKSNTAITQIWVANGTYYPAFSADSLLCTPINPRDKAFVLVNNVKVYGGFAGGETLLSQRNPVTNVTILSGDIGTTGVITDNCYHVLISSGTVGTALLDGFTITASNGNASGTITVNSNTVTRNLGGGVSLFSSSPTITDCRIVTNSSGTGGGIYINASAPAISNSYFSGNTAINGGGLFNLSSSNTSIDNSSFEANTATSNGGGIYNNGICDITNSIISGNTASSGSGGGLVNVTPTAAMTVTNCLISGNASFNSGGILSSSGGIIRISNCTVAANRGGANGGGVSFGNTPVSAPVINNSIFYGNKEGTTASNIFVAAASTSPTVSYSDIEGGFAGTNNISTDPLFTSPSTAAAAPTIAGDYSLQRCSPAINEGNNALIPGGITDDVLGNPRIALGNVDMGAYEMTYTLLNIVPNASGVVFVDFFKSGNGSSWVNACSNVADALLAADDNPAIKEIWVAKGTYFPKYNPFANLCSPNDRNNAFILVSKLKIFGGFAGGETLSSQANPTTNVTILSGDIGVTFTSSDNCYHVVIGAGAVSTASLNGFTIKSGNANAATTITVNSRNIAAACGAGIHLVASSPAITNCIISDNLATSNGAGMYDSLASAPAVSNCSFFSNTASKDAGALYNYTSSPTISNCTFTSNATTNVFGNSGGAIVNYTSSPVITNCEFTSNSSSSGGAIENKFTSIPLITDCSFIGNAASYGGGIENIISSAAVITNCIFSANIATILGGGINNNGSSPAITNCLFSGNLAANGGAVDNQAASNATYANCTFAANKATAGCGAITNQSSSNAIFKNSIIWGNTGTTSNTISNTASVPVVSFCLVQSGYASGTNITTTDPQFVSPQLASAAPTSLGDYRLKRCSSPAINAGSNALIPTGITTDLLSLTRISNVTVDLGAYEFQLGTPNASGIVFVDSTKNGDGTSWSNALTELADALKAAKTNSSITQIWVANGTYKPLYDAAALSCSPANTRDKSFLLVNNVKLYGGFAGGETLLSQRNWVTNVTTLSGDIGVASDTSDNSYHVVVSAGAVGTAALNGFTITLGTAALNTNATINSLLVNRCYGGGMHCTTSSPEITNCIFYKNYAYFYGGGMYNNAASPIISGCTYNSNNVYNGTGGGIYSNVSSPIITDCTFSENLCSSSGAGLVNYNCTSIINRCIFTGNFSSNNGGGLSNSNSTSVTITNCVFSGNKAPFGAAVSNFISTSGFINCTFSGNNATSSGGAIYNANSSVTSVKNSIIYGNTAPSFPSIQIIVGTTVTASYSLIEGGFTGIGNINVNPAFVSPVSATLAPTNAGDYRIPYCSGAVNTGDSTLLPIGITLDLDSNTRVKFTNVDMGAYEVQTLPLTITPTAGIVYVDSTKNGNGSSWANAVPELADALKAAKTNTAITQIWVAKGTYKPIYDVVTLSCSPVDIRDKTFLMVKNVKLYGGFAGTETLLSQRDFVNNVTTLSGDNGVLNDSLDNCYHVVVCADSAGTATLDGFTVTRGYASGSVAPNVVVNTKNTIRPYGGGMQIISSSPLIQNVIFSNNSSSQDAGALYMSLSLPVINNCTFSGNVANTAGAIEIAGSSNCILNRCKIINNQATGNCGGIFNSASNPSIRNCLIAGNLTPNAGGGIYNSSASPSIINCTIAGNKAFGGGGIYTVFSSNALIKNSIIWGNIATSSGNAFYTTGGGAITVSYSNIEGGSVGTANINTDPLFVNPQSANLAPTSAGDYHLQNCSQSINTGSNALVISGDTTDLDDSIRIKFITVDMGAYEMQASTVHNIVPTGGIVFVDKTKPAGADGSSWTNAIPELADALKAAKLNTSITQIWVAKGTYKPLYNSSAAACNSSSSNRDNSFVLINNVKVYGGFAGGETLLSQRNWLTNPTILSGDIGLTGDSTDNCYHVVISAGAVGTAALDGFTVTRATADGSSSVTVNNKVITRFSGGGMYNTSSSPIITNCIFTNNYGGSAGGMKNDSSASPNISNCSFTNNTASSSGGGLSNGNASTPAITNCIFQGNSAGSSGGGAMSNSNCSPVITGCTFTVNTTNTFGAGINNFSSSPTITNCTFSGNTAASLGGALYNNSGSAAIISRCYFKGNTATFKGGAIVNTTSAARFTNCVISGNKSIEGGGIYNFSTPVSTFINCTVAGNSAASAAKGGGFYNFLSADVVIKNCIIYRNVADSITNNISNFSSTPVISYSNIEGGYPGTGNIQASPVFVNAVAAISAPTSLGDYHISDCSAGIDLGDSTLLPVGTTVDLDSNTRVKYYNVDMGAFEVQTTTIATITPTAGILYVDKTKSGNGSSWANAITELADALKAAKFNAAITQIWVAQGTYYPKYSASGLGCAPSAFSIEQRNNAFVLIKNVKIYGGFGGFETSVSQRVLNFYNTYLSGDVNFVANNSDNCNHVLISAGDVGIATLDGFIVRNGYASSITDFTINNKIIYGYPAGAGMYITASSPAISNCIFDFNEAEYGFGGGMFTDSSSSAPIITNCSFLNNTAIFGGGIVNSGSSPTYINCKFSGNSAIEPVYSGGGGLYNYNCPSITFTNCLISGNTATHGAGMFNERSFLTFNNTTVTGNLATVSGGGMYSLDSSVSSIQNCIVYNNFATVSGNNIMNLAGSGSTSTVSYSLIEGGFAGTGNINSNPLFVFPFNPSNAPTPLGNYRLQECSPAINIGNNSLIPSGITTDLNGTPRVISVTVDMGAYEFGLIKPDAAGIVYVDALAGGNFNGSSWVSANKSLAKALKAAKGDTTIKQIWVANGTYYPEFDAATLDCSSTDNRDRSFVLVNNVKVYGGFAGGETLLSQRNWVTNVTTLSGDIGIPNDTTDNAYHVVIGAGAIGNAVFDGFTITKGVSRNGVGSTITVNSILLDRSLGGGMINGSSSPNISNCIFTANVAALGGGMYSVASSSPIISNTIFRVNAAFGGGGMYNHTASSPIITGCIFSENIASSGSGGGLINETGSNAIIKQCYFIGNSSTSFGGGILNINSSPAITNCVISGNISTGVFGGGGISNNASSSPTFINCTIASNKAAANGGGYYNSSSNPIIKNCIIYGNTAVSGNSIFNTSSTPAVSYSIVEGGFTGTGNLNVNPAFVNALSSTLAPTTGGDYRIKDCSAAINAGDSTLLPSGITVDLDSNQRVKFTNVDMGAFEIQNSSAITASHTGGILYVDSTKNGSGNSWTNALKELSDALKAAKNNAAITQIWVAKGTYFPLYDAVTSGCSSINNRDASFVLVNNVKVYGGFAGGETLLSQRNWVTNTSTLSGDIGLLNDTTDNAFHVVISSGAVGTAELNGFTIKIGIAVGGSSTITVNANSIDRSRGAGLYTNLSSPAINNCIITQNAAGLGGGIYNINSSPIYTDCLISNNKSNGGGGMLNSTANAIITKCIFSGNITTGVTNGGGGLMNGGASPIITDCLFTGNSTAGSFGGGGILNNNACAPVITNCVFSSNSAPDGGAFSSVNNPSGPSPIVNNCYFIGNASSQNGGAISTRYAQGIFTNCVISGNRSVSGGAVYTSNLNNASPPFTTFTNCTIAANRATGTGGGFYNESAANSIINNCIVYGNTAPTTNTISNTASTISVSYSLIEGGFAGTGNINVNPTFVSPQLASAAPTILGEYRLQSCSPAVNAGDSTLLPIGTTLDLDSNTRIKFTNVDMGAYEMQAVDFNNSTWRGFNTNWDSVINWCGGYIPTDSTNVIIPTGVTNYPVISSSNANTKNILLANNTSVTINNTGKLTIKGTYTNNGSVITNIGSLVMGGTDAGQNFPGTLGTIAAMNNLELANTSGINLDKSFSITGTLTPTAGAINLTNDTITLASSATGTARVATVQTGTSFSYTGTGRFRVQRYHPARRAWRLMTSPLYGTGTIFETWQNNGVYTPGKGTLVTGPGPTGAAGNGLDTSQLNNPSLKSGVPITNILNTKIPLSGNTGLGADNKGYFIFIRGDRNPINTNIINSNITTLSSVGKLQTGAQNFTASATANGFTLIGNPYASPVNFSMLGRTNLANRFYIWDPQLNSVGGYVVIEKLTGLLPYSPTPASPGGQDSIIQSSQAIYVQTIFSTSASLGFVENNKVVPQNSGIFRPMGSLTLPPSIQSNLYIVNSDTAILADGNIVVFDETYNNGTDIEDAIKFTNINETFGLVRNGQALAIERKQLNPANDTVFYKLTKTTQQDYRFEIEFNNINITNLTPYFEDDYLHTSTLLNADGLNTVNFNINGDVASANPLRFRIVFKQTTTLPVTITSIKAWKQNKDIAVEWKVENQLNIREYVIEKSADGHSFIPIGTQTPLGNVTGNIVYNFIDEHPLTSKNYYRIRSNCNSGLIQYSKIVLVKMDKTPSVIVYPNPVVNGTINLQMNEMPTGKYAYNLLNETGQLLLNGSFNHDENELNETIKPENKLPQGIYQLVLFDEHQNKTTLKLMVQ